MKTILMVLVIFCFITLSLISQGCNLVIPDYLSKAEVEDSLELRLKGATVEKEIEILDSAGIITTKSDNNYITDNYGRKLVIVVNPHKTMKQTVDIYDSDNNFLKEEVLPPNTIRRIYLTQTVDEKLLYYWKMGDKKTFLVIKEFPLGPPKMAYNGELCHSLSYGYGN